MQFSPSITPNKQLQANDTNLQAGLWTSQATKDLQAQVSGLTEKLNVMSNEHHVIMEENARLERELKVINNSAEKTFNFIFTELDTLDEFNRKIDMAIFPHWKLYGERQDRESLPDKVSRLENTLKALQEQLASRKPRKK